MTCISNRNNLPAFYQKLQAQCDSKMHCSSTGLLDEKWIETKEVITLSNCHKPEAGLVHRKKKMDLNVASLVQSPFYFTIDYEWCGSCRSVSRSI